VSASYSTPTFMCQIRG